MTDYPCDAMLRSPPGSGDDEACSLLDEVLGEMTGKACRMTFVITCHLRYEIDPRQIAAFEEYVTGWIPIVTRFGGTHHGCYLPHEGANDIAYALFSFPSLAAYEEYRVAIRTDPNAQKLWQLSAETGCIRRFDRTFLRPALDRSEVEHG